MGCTFSTKKTSIPSSKSQKIKKTIKIVHFNGNIQEFDQPLTVAEVTSYGPTKHFLFTHSQLLASGSTPLKRGTVLEPGRVYFLLPSTLFGPNVSPSDLAPITRKLMSKAQRSRSKSKSRKKKSLSSPDSLPSSASSSIAGDNDNSPTRSSPSIISSHRLHLDHRSAVGVKVDDCQVKYEMKSCKPRSWKPMLCTISEISFNK